MWSALTQVRNEYGIFALATALFISIITKALPDDFLLLISEELSVTEAQTTISDPLRIGFPAIHYPVNNCYTELE